ncbi:hypothetical protein TanjilG_05189 [Lupinus angustifolius]|uniref:Uncharacterized protein n=1 Tax=Lupinus angustifolius TaxID=3871 RepID=A0A4P1RBD3_LUPAN|nr:hypothetical protein TanjilG_05189 [Lupinus angustifolius]
MKSSKIAKTRMQLHRENERCEICEEKWKKRNGNSQLHKVIKAKEKRVVYKNVKVNDEVVKEKLGLVQENVVQNSEVNTQKEVIIDDAIHIEASLLPSENGGVVIEDKDKNFFSTNINGGESDPFPGWNEFQFQAEQSWSCSYPYWETQDGAFNFWEVEPSPNDWVESLWVL